MGAKDGLRPALESVSQEVSVDIDKFWYYRPDYQCNFKPLWNFELHFTATVKAFVIALFNGLIHLRFCKSNGFLMPILIPPGRHCWYDQTNHDSCFQFGDGIYKLFYGLQAKILLIFLTIAKIQVKNGGSLLLR